MGRNQTWWFFMAAIVVATLLPSPTKAGRLELKNEISGVSGVRKSRLSVRCWSNENDLGWDVIKPMECQFRSGFGTTSQDVVTIAGFGECGDGRDECIWVSKRDGFYQRRVVRDEGGRKEFIDVLKSKWVWKW
ncbi:hypothetical protein HID58_049544 [Brassica napus]|uniref:S-protein homolog n=1 Tax=Brassica napus TaxID=3708 RepID=A0ABQ8B6U4_BRANA|nr:hypothetical protein HID58_049544 [Brassica napus]